MSAQESKKEIPINWNTKDIKQFINALLVLETPAEAEAFVRDLMTEGEILEFSRRLEAARLLSKKVYYDAIIEKTGLSSTTIARISKWLKGSLGGYRLVLGRLDINNKHHHPSLQVSS